MGRDGGSIIICSSTPGNRHQRRGVPAFVPGLRRLPTLGMAQMGLARLLTILEGMAMMLRISI
jgi:hypothetical protein